MPEYEVVYKTTIEADTAQHAVDQVYEEMSGGFTMAPVLSARRVDDPMGQLIDIDLHEQAMIDSGLFTSKDPPDMSKPS